MKILPENQQRLIFHPPVKSTILPTGASMPRSHLVHRIHYLFSMSIRDVTDREREEGLTSALTTPFSFLRLARSGLPINEDGLTRVPWSLFLSLRLPRGTRKRRARVGGAPFPPPPTRTRVLVPQTASSRACKSVDISSELAPFDLFLAVECNRGPRPQLASSTTTGSSRGKRALVVREREGSGRRVLHVFRLINIRENPLNWVIKRLRRQV